MSLIIVTGTISLWSYKLVLWPFLVLVLCLSLFFWLVDQPGIGGVGPFLLCIIIDYYTCGDSGQRSFTFYRFHELFVYLLVLAYGMLWWRKEVLLI